MADCWCGHSDGVHRPRERGYPAYCTRCKGGAAPHSPSAERPERRVASTSASDKVATPEGVALEAEARYGSTINGEPPSGGRESGGPSDMAIKAGPQKSRAEMLAKAGTKASKAAPAATKQPRAKAEPKPQADHRHSWDVHSKKFVKASPSGLSFYFERDATCKLCGVREREQGWSETQKPGTPIPKPGTVIAVGAKAPKAAAKPAAKAPAKAPAKRAPRPPKAAPEEAAVAEAAAAADAAAMVDAALEEVA